MSSYYVFYVNKGHHLIFPTINLASTSFAKLADMIAKEISIRPSDLILLDLKGSAPDLKRKLIEMETFGKANTPLFLFHKCNNDRDDTSSSDINYIYQMMADAIEQMEYVLSLKDNERIYMELPDKANNCQMVTEKILQTCATLIQEQHHLNMGWQALINNLDVSVNKMEKKVNRFNKLIAKMGEITAKSENLFENYDSVLEQLKKIDVPAEISKQPSALSASQAPHMPPPESKFTLYDFIALADPSASLEDLPAQIEEHIKRLYETNSNEIIANVGIVVDQARSADYREIRGMHKRMGQLEHSLTLIEEHNLAVKDFVKKIISTPKKVESQMLPGLINNHRNYVAEIVVLFEKLKAGTKVFHHSKGEVLENIRSRLTSFIVGSYDKLSIAHQEIVDYEVKGDAIRLQMDLIGQLRDAPILYSQTISEILRRSLLKAELGTWHGEHAQRCITFYDEEKKMREQVGRKLKKHFLHALFPSLFDEMPEFFVKSLDKFDDEIPKIDKEYILQLRQSIPELAQYLKVTLPNVSNKLDSKTAKTNAPLNQSHRVDSFITEEPMRMAKSHFNYSPATWMSEDGGDSSPVPTMMMARSPDSISRNAKNAAIPIAPSLQHIDGLSSSISGSSCAKSAPIAIPYEKTIVPTTQTSFIQSDESLKFMCENEESQITIADDQQQFQVDDVVSSTEQLEFLKPMKTEILTLSRGLLDVRAEVINSDSKFKEDFEKINDFLAKVLPEQIAKLQKAHADELEKVEQKFNASCEKFESATKKCEDFDESLANLKNEYETALAAEKEKNAGCEERIAVLEQEKKGIETETFKKLTIEYELMNDRTRSDYDEQLANKDMEIAELKRELEKKNAELQKHQFGDPYGEEMKKEKIAEIRSELEKEYKTRIEFITKAVEQKKDEGFARQKKESEVEIKVLEKENESKAIKLEALENEIDNLRMIIQTQVKDGSQILVDLENSLSTSTNQFPNTIHRLQVSPRLAECDMDESMFLTNSSLSASTVNMQTNTSDLDMEFIRKDKNNAITQTKLTSVNMNVMVTVQDVKPGCTVLVIWDERHNAYILFCSSQNRHFVKESSVKKLGLNVPPSVTSAKKNWILARVVKIDSCSIKKALNRYSLEIGTIVRRVEVEPVENDNNFMADAMKASISLGPSRP